MTRRHGWFRCVAALTLVVFALTGCAAIADSGPVQTGLDDLTLGEDAGQLQYNPLSPAVGASQEDLVRGFLQAATSSAHDYSVAREFLTADYADQWDPNHGVLIDGGRERQYRSEGEMAGVLSLAATAKVDGQGLMLPVKPGANTDFRFEFTRVEDEWRISSAPAGIILDASTFTTIWSERQIFFVGEGGFLVPETRWFLNRTALTTEIVNALLSGPGERMRDVLRTGFPSGTALISNSVPVVDGRARIDLSSAVLDASPAAMVELGEQLRSSLHTVPGVSGFDLMADGTPIPMNRVDGVPDLRVASDAAGAAVQLGTSFGTMLGGDLVEFPGISENIVGAYPSAVTLSPDENAAALLSSAGVSRVDDQGSVLIDTRPGQLAPDFDALGYVWTAQDSGELRATGPDGVAHRVGAAWLAGRNPVAVRISPDGSRVAALVRDDDRSVVLVAGLIRDASGVPEQTVVEAEPQLWAVGEPIDLDWVGQTRFAVLSKSGVGTKVTMGGPGSFSSDQGSVPDGSQLAGNGSHTQLRVLSSDGELFSSQGGGWQSVATGVKLLAKRG